MISLDLDWVAPWLLGDFGLTWRQWTFSATTSRDRGAFALRGFSLRILGLGVRVLVQWRRP